MKQVINTKYLNLQCKILHKLYKNGIINHLYTLTHCGRVTQICVFTLQLCETVDANLRF